jgi:two-component system, NtrC family, nitrogen regulation sensor histidine kinase NtrY
MMFYKRFNFLVVFKLALIMINFIVIAIIFGDKRLFFNQIILCVVLVIQIGDLLRFINQTNRELTRLFLAIRHSDFSVTFKQSRLGNSFKELQESMGSIIEMYKEVKIEKEAQFHFLQLLVNQLNVGIIALIEEDISLMNPIAEKTLSIHGVKTWKIFKNLQSEFATRIEELEENSKQLLEIQTPEGKKFMLVHVSHLKILDKNHKLITFQDINSEIEQKEIEAWHKLIRILTHEIMNSVTPISSLTETLEALLNDKNGNQKLVKDLTEDNLNDIRFSLQTIRKRSDGLLHFIENYRKLTKVPKPHKVTIDLNSFFRDVESLMLPTLREKKINFQINISSDITLNADPVLFEQTVLNLITNSIHAVTESTKKSISVSVYPEDQYLIVRISDTGKGIPPKELSEIFIPFFSTKKDGSGIGLSLSKQIMSLHGGTIQVKSQEGTGTEMFLKFRHH